MSQELTRTKLHTKWSVSTHKHLSFLFDQYTPNTNKKISVRIVEMSYLMSAFKSLNLNKSTKDGPSLCDLFLLNSFYFLKTIYLL